MVRGKGRAGATAGGWMVDRLFRVGLSQCVLQADGELANRAFVKDMLEEAANAMRLGVARAH